MRRFRRQIAALDRAQAAAGNPDFEDPVDVGRARRAHARRLPSEMLDSGTAPDYEREAQRIAREMTEVEQARSRREWAKAQPDKPYPGWLAAHRGVVVLRRKFIAVDWMTHPKEWPRGPYGTGRLLIERESGQVWPIEGYGRPNRRYPLGNAANFTYQQAP